MRLYSYLALLLPFCIMLLSFGIVALIPGCTIDEGAGASSACGVIGPALAIGELGGFLWLLLGLFGLVPVLIIYTLFNRQVKNPTE